MKIFSLFIFLTVIFLGNWWFDTPVTQAFAGISLGLVCNLCWVMGGAQETAEYWRGAGPRWMQSIHKQLHKQNSLIQAKVLKYNINKAFAKVLGVVFILCIIVTRVDLLNNWWVDLVSLLTTSALGVCLIDWYFRWEYTRIGWKDIPPPPNLL